MAFTINSHADTTNVDLEKGRALLITFDGKGVIYSTIVDFYILDLIHRHSRVFYLLISSEELVILGIYVFHHSSARI